MPDLQTLLSKFLVDLYAGSFGGSGAPIASLTITGPGTGAALTNPTVDTLQTSGQMKATYFIASNGLEAAATGSIYWNSRTALSTPLNGQLSITNNASTIGVGMDVLTDGTLKVRTRAMADTAIVDSSRFSVAGVGGVVTFGPAAVASITVKGGIITAIS